MRSRCKVAAKTLVSGATYAGRHGSPHPCLHSTLTTQHEERRAERHTGRYVAGHDVTGRSAMLQDIDGIAEEGTDENQPTGSTPGHVAGGTEHDPKAVNAALAVPEMALSGRGTDAMPTEVSAPPRVSVVIPALNEAKNLPYDCVVVRRVFRA